MFNPFGVVDLIFGLPEQERARATIGKAELLDGADVAVRSAAGELLAVVRFEGFVDNGHASASQVVSVPLAQAVEGLQLVAGDDGTGTGGPEDCDPTNDTLAWRFDACDGG